MHLKQLEVQGFKSFPDRTVVSFGHDITAIVGPNGSGKSNISDAIRWVMGEQNSRSLRGQKMEDVIFGGTEKRAQVGFAEATLVLDNSDRALRYEADELMITRRYFRSGESEYYINKQSVRMRDVHELFMDTGLGREGYSNISQGRIDEILSLKSVDRREIFEEAAGISKYRHRKEETERRLAHTEDNLLRIGDKISELELQVVPLREQAEKAKAYLSFRDELKGLEVALWLHTLEKLSATARKAEEDYHSAAFILQQEHENLEKFYVTTETLTFDLHNRDMLIEQLRNDIGDSDAVAQAIRGEIAVLETNCRNIRDNLSRVKKELEEQDTRSTGIADQIKALEERMEQIDGQTAKLRGELAEAEAEGKKLADSSDGMTKRYFELRNAQERFRTELSAKSTDLSAVHESIARSETRRNEVTEDCETAAQRKKDALDKLRSVRRQLSDGRDEITACTNSMEGYKLRAKAREQKRDELKQKMDKTSVDLDTLRSRLRMFMDMEKEYEGFSKAVRVIMQESDRKRLQGIHGPVSKLIRVDDEYTIAIEIALGSAMQQIVVDNEQCAKAALQYLKRSDSGRATLLPMTVVKGRLLNERGVDQCHGFVGIASDLVHCEPKYADIIKDLLGRTVIAEDMDCAIAMANRFGHRFRIVTLDGQVINAGGSMTGGSVSRNTGMLSRANEIERLKVTEKELVTAYQNLKASYDEALRQTNEVNFELLSLEGKLRTAQDEVLRLEGEEKQYAVLEEAIGDAISSAEKELRSLGERIDSDQKRGTKLEAEIRELDKQIEDTERDLKQVSDGQSVAAKESNRLSDCMTKLRMEIAALEAEKTTAQESVASLRGLEQAMQGDRQQKLELINGYSQDENELLDQIKDKNDTLTAQDANTEKLREKLKTDLSERQDIESRKTSLEKDIQNKNKDILNMEREIARLESKKTSAEMEEKQIIDKLWDSYELTRSTAAEAAVELESVMAAQKRTAELKRKLNALGHPNIGAIDEYARVNERYEYLTGQRDDVLTSKKDLEGIIADITAQMTDIFSTEFAKINQYFGETFTEMFRGGKASLELEDPTAPLSCGIEIRVQPPGKQLKTITLLSGGEKAFVAIALYFAILKVRPTPFCMLDEIDAALDDRNVERFASYLRGFSGRTQFIVITHRRGTMEEADVLYGVTMQEQGISKILHLNLNQMEQQLGIKLEE